MQLASSSDRSQILLQWWRRPVFSTCFSPQLRDKIWEWPVGEANMKLQVTQGYQLPSGLILQVIFTYQLL